MNPTLAIRRSAREQSPRGSKGPHSLRLDGCHRENVTSLLADVERSRRQFSDKNMRTVNSVITVFSYRIGCISPAR